MSAIDDHTLMAYVDGELDPAQSAHVERALASSPELRRQAQVYEESAATLSRAMHAVLQAPVPEHIRDLADSEVPGPGWRARLRALWTKPPGLALAAVTLVVIGIGLGRLAPWPVTGDTLLPAGLDMTALERSRQWQRGLEEIAGGGRFSVTLRSPAPATVARTLTVLHSFADIEGRYCRTFAVEGDGAVLRRGLACREENGIWRSLVLVTEKADTATAGPDDGASVASSSRTIRPASAGADSVFDRAVEARMSTAPFTPERESELIRRAWKP